MCGGLELHRGDALFELLDRQFNRFRVLTGGLTNLCLLLWGEFDANLILRHGGLLGVEPGQAPGVDHGPNLKPQREATVNSVLALP
jgi:hypothetical protein